MTSGKAGLAAFAVILLDLAWRAGLDKVLALNGTPALGRCGRNCNLSWNWRK